MSLPSGLQALAKSENPIAREKAPVENHHQNPLSRIQKDPEPRIPEKMRVPPREEGRDDPQKGKETIQEVVEST